MNLSDFETVAAAKAYSEMGKRMISPDMMVAFLATFEIGRAVEIEDSEAAFALRKALQFGSEFNLMNGHVASVAPLLNQVTAATDAFKAYVIAYANPVIYPFAQVTQAQLNSAKNVFSAKFITYQQGKDLVITLNADLPEKVAVTVWRTALGFSDENAGRNAHIQIANKYRLDMRGKKSGDYQVRVPLLGVDFSVEVI